MMDKKSSSPSKPLIVRKVNITLLNKNLQNGGSFASKILKNMCRDDVLYDTTDMYFLKGEYQRLLLVNRYNKVTKSSRTIAKYFTGDGSVTEKTSDRVTEVIGQEQFNTLFTALCSILDQELKIRSILALLTNKSSEKSTTKVNLGIGNINSCPMKVLIENSCQTDEMRIDKVKPRRRIRKQASPYIVQDLQTAETGNKKQIRKIIVNIPTTNSEIDSSKNESVKSEKSPEEVDFSSSPAEHSENSEKPEAVNFERLKAVTSKRSSNASMTDLGYLHDEFSNDSSGRLSVLSDTPTDPELLTNPTSLIMNDIDQHTKGNSEDKTPKDGFKVPGTNIIVAYKPEDIFHIATKDNLQHLNNKEKKELLQHQFKIDHNHCLTVLDEDGNLPIHLAVINNDLELASRQCLVLKLRGTSVDIPANGLTALQLAVQTDAAEIVARLVRHGAAPLRVDASHRTSAHDAAERSPDVLRAVLESSRQNARKILYDDDELWKPEMEQQGDEDLGCILMNHMCSMFDKHGYTPLMLASRIGLYENVRLLLEHAPKVVNEMMPTSGNTALYLAVAAACNSSIENGNKSKVDDRFRKTIELLLEHGADPFIDNHSSAATNVNTLLQEFNNAELSMLIGNKQMLNSNGVDDLCKLILVIDEDGKVQYKKLENERKRKTVTPKKGTAKNKKLKTNEDGVSKSGNTDSDDQSTKKTVANKKDNENLKFSHAPVVNNVGQRVKRKKTAKSILIKKELK